MPTLCLGEALVDLMCERPVSGLAQADAFVPHFGGAVANVAVFVSACFARSRCFPTPRSDWRNCPRRSEVS
jgi:sugar/nucleoside kinase (ribokinase family)